MPRKSAATLAGESGLANLECIESLAQEAQEIEGSARAYRATYFRNESECKRWLAQMRAAGMPCPAFIRSSFPQWAYEESSHG